MTSRLPAPIVAQDPLFGQPVHLVNNSSGSRTLRRAIALLDVLAHHPHGVGLSTLAREAQLHHATAHRLLSTMVEGLLVSTFGDGPRYRLGLRLLDFAGTVTEGLEIRDVARPVLNWLSQTAAETAHIAVREADEMVYLDRVDGGQPVTLRTHVGFRAPVHVTAVGKAVLAWTREDELDRVLGSKPLRRYTQHTLTSPKAFIRHLAQVRRVGYSLDNEEHRIGIRCVAAPVRDRHHAVIAAISVSGPRFRMSGRRVREMAQMVKAAALRISTDLGWRAPGGGGRMPTPHEVGGRAQARRGNDSIERG